MKKNRFIHLVLLSAFVFISSCNKNDGDECNFMPEVAINVSNSHLCFSTGSIKIISPIDANYTYKLDQGNFQTNTVFENLATGNHTLFIKDNNGCEVSKEVSVEAIAKGNKFAEVETILKTRCSSCHSGLNPQAGIDFTRTCDILNHWNRIQARALEGNPTPMPPTGLISASP